MLLLLFRMIPMGSPLRGGDVAVYVFDINQQSLPTPFDFVLVSVSLFLALSAAFHSINYPDNSPLSHSALPVLFLPASLVLSTTYLFYESLSQPWYILVWLTGFKAPTKWLTVVQEVRAGDLTKVFILFSESKRGTWQSSCCVAGRLAATRHLHCHAQFHVDTLRMRESTDVMHMPQGMRLRPNGRLPPPWPRDMARCVLERPLLFQKCCYGYASARGDRYQRFHHRKARTRPLRDMYLSWRYINS